MTIIGSGKLHDEMFRFGYRRSADQDRKDIPRHPVVVIGAGPVGMTLALDLARRGTRVVLLDDADRIGEGSRAICFAKRTLEIFDRLGVGRGLVERGVQWQKGKVFQGEGLLYEFDLLPETGHVMPAFINIQQYYVERDLVEAIAHEKRIDLRWKNRVTALERHESGATLIVATPEGDYRIAADWVIACDGSRSPTRALLGLDFAGEVFEDQFLIADVKMKADFPTERWFWFNPPFHGGQSALLHKQPDDVWRIDLQLGREADAEAERQPQRVRSRIRAMLGHDRFDLEWVSVYRFQCKRLENFTHGRVIFAGDSAHQVSPFGARGANSGIQDADNLGWKLAAILKGEAPEALMATYDLERIQAAEENILNSTRATDFIAPPSPGEQLLRDAALALARRTAFAKRFVNSGRLSLPTAYQASPLSTPDDVPWKIGPAPGAPFVDAPLQGRAASLLSALHAGHFTLLVAGKPPVGLYGTGIDCVAIGEDQPFQDAEGLVHARYDLGPGDAYLLRPDGHVAARFRKADAAQIVAARDRALGLGRLT